VQTSFVDEPREAVEQADSLVANVVKRIAEQFANERGKLEGQWASGDDVNTEALPRILRSVAFLLNKQQSHTSQPPTTPRCEVGGSMFSRESPAALAAALELY
jgi:hypothetical protein